MERHSRRLPMGIAMKVWLLAVFTGAAMLLSGCNEQPPTTAAAPVTPPAPAPPRTDSLEILFTYGSEKKDWIDQSTTAFNQQKVMSTSGEPIVVKAIPMGSGDCIDEILSGARKPHLISPASSAFLRLGNAQSNAKVGKDVVGATDSLVLSPVVVAMWKPMAEALGWGKKPVGWAEILKVAKDPKGWGSVGQPQWGRFRFAHTHPEFSNSGLISLFAEVYAATGKVAGLTVADVTSPKVMDDVSSIEGAVVHYGTSTGFFADKMFANGPQYLSAAVLYESSVIESYSKPNLAFPIVAIYPKEGTFWSDHPVAIVDREWVTPEHRDAARKYIDFLLAKPQQENAVAFGFRPSSTDVTPGPPIDLAHGVDPKEPKTTLEVPTVPVMDAILKLWGEKKKHTNVTLVFDVSGSMQQDNRIANAREGAAQFITGLNDADLLSILAFSDQLNWLSKNQPLKTTRAQSVQTVGGLMPGGGTALYDAIKQAFDQQTADARINPDKISAIVVLTDGADTQSKLKLEELIAAVKSDYETKNVRIFTIAYGEADFDVLKKISAATQGKAYQGKPENIRSVFRDIATFF